MKKIIEWLEDHLISCVYKKYLGIECPGCGIQSSFIELLKGNIWESIKLYPPLIPVLFTLLFFVLHLLFRFKNSAKYLKIIFIITIAIVLINYIFRLTQSAE